MFSPKQKHKETVGFDLLCVVLRIIYLADNNSSDWVEYSAILKTKNKIKKSSWDYTER